MASPSDIMSEIVVPLLELPGIKKAPAGKLPSKADFLCLLYGSIGDNFVGFQGKILVISYNKLNTALNSDINFTGIGSLCCNMVRSESSCHGEGGCVEQQQPCLLQVVKENWEEIGISLKIDKDIRMMKDVKAKFDKARGEMSAEKVRI